MLDENTNINVFEEIVNDNNISDEMLGDLFGGEEVFTFTGSFFNGIDLMSIGTKSGTSDGGGMSENENIG